MAPVVVDSTCLIALERIDQLDILTRLFPDVAAPPAVAAEFSRSLPWLVVREISNAFSAAALQTQLHRGEAEAIRVADQVRAEIASQMRDQMKWMFVFWIGTLVPLAALTLALAKDWL